MRINFKTFSKVENIEIKSYLKSYINNIVEDNTKILTNFGNKELIQSINIYDFGTLLDNLLANAQQREAKQINIYFDEDNTKMHFVSDTGPIDIEPVDDIFKLGVTSRRRGTGLGLYICRQICQDFDWKISASQIGDNLIDFVIEFSGE